MPKQLPAMSEPPLREHPTRWGRILPLLALTAGIIIFYRTWYTQIEHTAHWLSSFQQGTIFGETCEYTVGDWQERDTFESVLEGPHEFTLLKMPYRDAPPSQRPVVKPGQYLLTRCTTRIKGMDDSKSIFVQLGNIFGDSAIFVNKALIHLQDDDGLVQFPVAAAWRHKPMTIEIISRASSDMPTPGAASLLPFVYTDSREILDSMNRTYKFWSTEIPAFLLGYTLALFIFFAAIWILGLRYADVSWMVVLLGILAVHQFIEYTPIGKTPRWTNIVTQCLTFSELLGLAVFVIAFLRLRVAWLWREGLFLVTVTAYVLAAYFLPQTIKRAIDLRLAFPYSVAAVIFLVLTVVSFRHRRTLDGMRRSRVRIVTASAALASLLCAAQVALTTLNAVQFGDYVIYGFASLFAVFLATDLAVFQRQYFKERVRRAEEESAKLQLEERLELGRSVQQILMPKDRTGNFLSYQFELFHQAASTMAGDWLYIWDVSPAEKRLFFGDVMGKGPQAAIVVSAVMAFLHECKRRAYSVEECIEYLNTSLSEIFEQRTTSTFAAVVLLGDDKVRLFNCGTVGWFHATRLETHHISTRNAALGMGKLINPTGTTLKLDAGDTLLSFSDGVLEGSRESKKLMTALTDATVAKLPYTDIFNLACKLGGHDRHYDDQTMIIVKR